MREVKAEGEVDRTSLTFPAATTEITALVVCFMTVVHCCAVTATVLFVKRLLV